MDVRLMGRRDLTHPERSRLDFGFQKGMATHSGLESLIQIVLVNLLTNPASDALHPKRGGGLPGALREAGSSADPTQIASAVQRAVSKTEREILADQAQYGLPSTERLAELQLEQVLPEVGAGRVHIRLRLINEAGESRGLFL